MKKKTQKTIIWISICLILITIISLFLFVKPNVEVHYFYDKDLGVIKTEIKTFNWLTLLINNLVSLTQQAVTFSTETAKVGDSISMTEYISNVGYIGNAGSMAKDCMISGLSYSFLRDNVVVGDSGGTLTLSTPIRSFQPLSHTYSLTPLHTGVYKATTTYQAGICDMDGTDCISYADCVAPTSQTSTNSVTVEAEEPTECDNIDRWGSWTEVSHTNNALIKKREHIDVSAPPGCSETFDNTEYTTDCDPGYIIEGTTSDTSAGEQKNCILPVQTNNSCTSDSQCTSLKKCHPTLNVCSDSDCNGPKMENCTDGSQIIRSDCINGFLVLTTNQCPTLTNETKTYFRLTNLTNCSSIVLLVSAKTTKDYDTLEACKAAANLTGNKTVYINCWAEKSIVSQTFVFAGNKTVCNSKTYPNTCPTGWYSTERLCEESQPLKINWWLYGGIGGIILLIIIIITIVVIRMKK